MQPSIIFIIYTNLVCRIAPNHLDNHHPIGLSWKQTLVVIWRKQEEKLRYQVTS